MTHYIIGIYCNQWQATRIEASNTVVVVSLQKFMKSDQRVTDVYKGKDNIPYD